MAVDLAALHAHLEAWLDDGDAAALDAAFASGAGQGQLQPDLGRAAGACTGGFSRRAARQGGRSVMIDFTSRYCAPCRDMERNVFHASSAALRDSLKSQQK